MRRKIMESQRKEHEKTTRLLSDYLEGTIEVRDREYVEQHLAQCELCSNGLASLRMARELLRDTPEVEPPRSFAITRQAVAYRERGHLWGMAMATAASLLLFLGASAGQWALGSTATAGKMSPAPAVQTYQAAEDRAQVEEGGKKSAAERSALSQAAQEKESSAAGPSQTPGTQAAPPPEAQQQREPPRSGPSLPIFAVFQLALGVVTAALAISTLYMAWRSRRRTQ